MRQDYTLVELAAGSAALARWLLGAPKLVSYQGGKQGYASAIAETLGLEVAPSRVVLVDPGPWGEAWAAMVSAQDISYVADILSAWSNMPDRDLWGSLREDPPTNACERAAGFLFLQAREWGGKPAGWAQTAGFKPEEYPAHWNTPTRHAGRWDNPRPVLIERLRKLAEVWPSCVEVHHSRAENVAPSMVGPTVVYIDPPYQEATGYADDWSRESVLTSALSWHEAGAEIVAVSEAEVLGLPSASSYNITRSRVGQHRVRSKQKTEILTVIRNHQ